MRVQVTWAMLLPACAVLTQDVLVQLTWAVLVQLTWAVLVQLTWAVLEPGRPLCELPLAKDALHADLNRYQIEYLLTQ